MASEQEGYLPPDQQLTIAAKVNRICEIPLEEFNPQIHLNDVKEIIKALDPRLQIQRGKSIKLSWRDSGESTIAAGATNAGNISASFQQETTKELRFNLKDYRIGGYVVTKRSSRNEAALFFRDFWDPTADGVEFGVLEPSTEITYDPKSLDPIRVTRIAYIPRVYLGFIHKPKRHPLDMWPQKDRD